MLQQIPELLNREQMLGILQEEEYGRCVPEPCDIRWEIEKDFIPNFCAGKAVCNRVTAKCTINRKPFSFSFFATIPTDKGTHPFFVNIGFRDLNPDRYVPTEELIDYGFAVFSFCYDDITKDNDDFTDGLAGILYENGCRKPNDAGKIAMWAWGAQRIMDYAETLDGMLDFNYAIVCGHSRLGKTALLAAALDERFTFAYSNNSGCSGAALTRGKRGETVKDICERFPYWFCENYKKYMEDEQNMPFDQHYLLASIAPRKVLVGSASEDIWADPVAEQYCCLAAAPAFEKGFVCDQFPAEIGDEFLEGDIGYHLRKGLHYYSREDWLKLIKFVQLKKNNINLDVE